MNLEELRKNIDDIDDRLFDLLQQRLKIVDQVGRFKRTNASSQYIIRPGREALKVKKAHQQAVEAGLDETISKAIASIWREIISLSINFEDPAKIAYNSGKSKDTYWLLREYFGAYSEMVPYKLDKEVIKSLLTKTNNIAAFVVENNAGFSPWWLELTKHPNLSVFAAASIFAPRHGEDEPLTLLVSNVTPEPTGEDKFVYVITKPLPDEEKDNFEVISHYKENFLITSDEFYNNYQDKLGAKYIGCFAKFDF